jgi:hypothetical protein
LRVAAAGALCLDAVEFERQDRLLGLGVRRPRRRGALD